MKVNINFFDYLSVLRGFSKLYKLSENEIMRLVVETTDAYNPTAEFIEKTGIKLDTVDITGVSLHCKHITTVNDDFESLKQYGLLTLDKALTYPTPLNKFLLEHGLEVDVVNRDIYYKGIKIHIYESDEECESCFYGTDCQNTKDRGCDYRKKLSTIRSKLYHNSCGVEVHLSDVLSGVLGYSSVRKHPEILCTLDNLIMGLFREGAHLQRDWVNQQQEGKYYCLDFDINIFNFEDITTGKKFESHEYDAYFDFNEKPLYDLYTATPNYFGNVLILQEGLRVLRNEVTAVYGQIIPDTNIRFEDLKISEFTNY